LAAAALRDHYEPLVTAIKRGDWDAATNFLSLNEYAKSARISKDGCTVLHVAVIAGRTENVEMLVELLSAEELEITD
jgi:ankyrin repeat protein